MMAGLETIQPVHGHIGGNTVASGYGCHLGDVAKRAIEIVDDGLIKPAGDGGDDDDDADDGTRGTPAVPYDARIT
jgi:hypothetical protein